MSGEFEPKSILDAIKKASSFDIFLISFIALPFIFQAWLGTWKMLGLSHRWKLFLLAPVSVLYIVGVVAMLWGNSKVRQREVARDLIVGYLTTRSFKMMSYERIRSRISGNYSDEFLEDLPVHFPETLRRANLKHGKAGLARIEESEVQEEG